MNVWYFTTTRTIEYMVYNTQGTANSQVQTNVCISRETKVIFWHCKANKSLEKNKRKRIKVNMKPKQKADDNHSASDEDDKYRNKRNRNNEVK